MTMQLLVAGSPGSPYTRKLVAALRYRRVPYRLVLVDPEHPTLPQPKVRLLPTVYFDDGAGGTEPMVDTTPILRRLDALLSDRPVAPADGPLRFLDALVEDYADEWLTKVMFHYRWSHRQDREKSARVLPNWFQPPLGDADLAEKGESFAVRQVERLGYVGSNDTTSATIERSFSRLLAWLDRHLSENLYLFGSRPVTADFALYGQLSQLALFDPTPRGLVETGYPRTLAWTLAMDDLSGVDESMLLDPAQHARTFDGLLGEIGRTYVPLLLANDRAMAAGAGLVELEIDGSSWRQAPFPYHRRCLGELRHRHSALPAEERRIVDRLLAGTGCEALF